MPTVSAVRCRRVPCSSAAIAVIMIASMAGRGGAQTITVSGDPGVLAVRVAVAGAEPESVTEAMTTYAVTTTAPDQRIVARLDAPLPDGVTLTLQLAAPSGATSRGPVTLSTAEQELMSVPTAGSHAGLAISYTVTAKVRAGPQASLSRAVTLTVVSGP